MTRLICWDARDCRYAYQKLSSSLLIANDIETLPFNKKKPGPIAITVNAYSGLLKDGSIESFAFPFQLGKSPTSGTPESIVDIYRTVKEVNDLPIRQVMHNGVYDSAWQLYYGIPVRNYAYDTMSMWWSRYPDLPKRLDFVSSVLLDNYRYWKGDRKSDDFVEYMNYAMDDTESTLRNCLKLIEMMMHDPKMRLNFFHAHLRSLSGLHMSAMGMAVDESVMSAIKTELDSEAAKALESLRNLVADSEFNPNSPAQKKELLYGILGAKPRNAKGRFVKRVEDASTGAVPMRAMRAEHPIFRRVVNGVLAALTPSKQISNVVGLARFPAGSTGSRLLCSYDGVGTTTTRYSSRGSAFGFGGNTQNVRKDYRRFARADAGCFLMEVDYSAADDVFVAFESREQKKIDLVRSGLDTHATNALIFFANWTYDRIVEGKNAKDPKVVHPITGVRQITKKVVHGCHYLMAAMTLFMNAGREAIVAAALESGYGDAATWPEYRLIEFCDLLDHKFRAHYPRFQREHDSADSWYRELRREVVTTGGYYTPFRYFQRFHADPRDDSTLRAVAATAGQAGTAGRINMVMDELLHGYIPRWLRDAENPNFGDRPRLVGSSLNGVSVRLQTHDSITFNIDPQHPKWQTGIDDVLYSFSRPIIIHGEDVRVGIEADVSIPWGGASHNGVKGRVIHSSQDVIPWLGENGLKFAA